MPEILLFLMLLLRSQVKYLLSQQNKKSFPLITCVFFRLESHAACTDGILTSVTTDQSQKISDIGVFLLIIDPLSLIIISSDINPLIRKTFTQKMAKGHSALRLLNPPDRAVCRYHTNY